MLAAIAERAAWRGRIGRCTLLCRVSQLVTVKPTHLVNSWPTASKGGTE